MGQKVNPVGFRLGVNRGWDSVWYAKKKDFGNYLIEDFKIREYIKKNVINSGVSKVMIERTANKCYVTIYTSRPGFVIGKKGSDIDKIKNNLSKFTSNEVTLNIKDYYFLEIKTKKNECMKRVIQRDIKERGKDKKQAENDFLKSWSIYYEKFKPHSIKNNTNKFIIEQNTDVAQIMKKLFN